MSSFGPWCLSYSASNAFCVYASQLVLSICVRQMRPTGRSGSFVSSSIAFCIDSALPICFHNCVSFIIRISFGVSAAGVLLSSPAGVANGWNFTSLFCVFFKGSAGLFVSFPFPFPFPFSFPFSGEGGALGRPATIICPSK